MTSYIPLRDIALLPDTEVILVFGRPESVELLERVGEGGLIAFSTQHDFTDEAPTPADVFTVGVLASIIKLRQTSPTTYSAIFRVGAAVELDPDPPTRTARILRELERTEGRHTDHSRQIVQMLHSRCNTPIPLPSTPGGAADTLASVLLLARPHDQQAILEELNPHTRLTRLAGMLS